MADEIETAFSGWLRDFTSDGIPSSGINRVSKAEGRDVGRIIQDQYDALTGQIAAVVSGVHFTDPVRVSATTNVTISSALENGDTVDGIVLATGNRVALMGQTNPAQNGIYIVPASGAASRATDADIDTELSGITFYVTSGTRAGNTYTCATPLPIVVGTTALTFVLTSQLDTSAIDAAIAGKADITGAALVNPTATTPVDGDNSTKIATTEWVNEAITSAKIAAQVIAGLGAENVDAKLAAAIQDQIYYMRTTVGRAATGATIWDCLRRFFLMSVSKEGSLVNWKDPTGQYIDVRGTAPNELAYHEGRGWHAAPSNNDTAYLELANPGDLAGVTQNDYAWGIAIFLGEFSSSGVMFQAGATDVIGDNVLSFQAQLNTSPGSFGTKMMAASVNSSTTIAGESAVGYTGCSRIASGSYTAVRNGAAETETRTSTGVPDGTLRILGGYEGGISLWFDGLGLDPAIIEDGMHDVVSALTGRA